MHSYGGAVMHDVINIRHAKKAVDEGADGLILVCAGAGGHAGALSPFALVREVREFFDGPVALSGSISHGASILSAQAMVRILLTLAQDLLLLRKRMLLKAIKI